MCIRDRYNHHPSLSSGELHGKCKPEYGWEVRSRNCLTNSLSVRECPLEAKLIWDNGYSCLLYTSSNGLNDLLEEANGYDIIYGNHIDQLEKKQYHPKSKSYRIVKHLMFCCHQALIIKRDVIKSLGGFNINYLLCADFDLIQRAYLSGYKFKQISCDVCVFSLAGVSNKSLYGTDKEVRRISINNGCYKYISLVQMYYLIRKTVKYLLLKFHII